MTKQTCLTPCAVLAAVALIAVGCSSVSRTQPDGTSPAESRTSPHRELRVQAELVSPLGIPLLARAESDFPRLATDLADARRAFDERPNDIEASIWLGRRLGYLWRMSDAIRVYSDALAIHADAPELLRHRGHRYISVRQFDAAIADLTRAAGVMGDRADEVESDGMPNARNIPLTTLGFNVWYHLALAHYLTGDFEAALHGWHRAARHGGAYDDNRIAIAYWSYLSLRRLGRAAEAQRDLDVIRVDMDVIENHAYHHLLLLYKGLMTVEDLTVGDATQRPDFAAVGYGVGLWLELGGRTVEARDMFERVIAAGEWPAFGYIAAERELVRLRSDESRAPREE